VFSNPLPINKADKVKLWRKIAYAIGSLPYSMCNTVVGFYFSIFLLEVAIVSNYTLTHNA